MEIRHPRTGDAPALAAVHVQSWRDAYEGLLPDDLIASMTVERRQAMWERIIESHASNAWLAEDDGTVRAKQRLKELFCPASDDWRRKVIGDSTALVRTSLRGLATLGET